MHAQCLYCCFRTSHSLNCSSERQPRTVSFVRMLLDWYEESNVARSALMMLMLMMLMLRTRAKKKIGIFDYYTEGACYE